MPNNFRLNIENIRSLVGPHDIAIKPLTIVIGENSSGKSTLLASIASISQSSGFPHKISFNLPPFELGGVETIITQSVKADKFKLGFRNESGPFYIQATYIVSSFGQFEISNIIIEHKDCKLDLSVEGNKSTIKFSKDKSGEHIFERELPEEPDRRSSAITQSFRDYTIISELQKVSDQLSFSFFNLIYGSDSQRPDIVAISPIRTKPLRTYDSITDDYSPEGEHIPFILNKIYSKKNPNNKEKLIIKAINNFGVESGLFRKVTSKKFGRSSNDPFKIVVNSSGLEVNLKDVGYGVSQALPIIVQSLIVSSEQTLLLQQPEVHLHPRAQAALGSFFSALVKHADKRFVIETHSDFILDRIRQEVAKGTISPEQLEIIYCEIIDRKTKIHSINVDSNGNLENVPQGYRNFFMSEQIKLLNRGSR